ncbi:hypothetical protein Tco_0299835 [Tanacetum coccineum]
MPRGGNQKIIELATTVDQEDEIIYSQLDDARLDYLVPLGHSQWIHAIRSAESRLSETKTVSRGTKDSEEPQDSDDRATRDNRTCLRILT